MRALVTGAGRGYGAVVARHLSAAGIEVVALGRDEEALALLAAEIDARVVVADVLDVQALDRTIGAVLEESGPIEVLVNNAGIGGTLGLAWEQDRDEWWHTVEVNVRGTHNVTGVVLPSMLEHRAGRIINIVSHAGTARWPYGSSYAVSKAAIIKYGENLATELKKHGVAVLNYHPGILEIGLTATLFASNPTPGTTDYMVAEWFHRQIDEGRAVDPEVSADGVVRLASGNFDVLSGCYLTAYDDLDELLARADEIKAGNRLTLGLLEI